MSQKSTEYCQNLVRAHDYDRYLLSLFAPISARPHLWALFAFNYEIAKTREVVSDTTIGLIRLQWWRDAIAEIYEGHDVRRHEVVQPLEEAIKKFNLPREDFDNLIYAREFDLEGVTPANIDGLINYCDFTTTPLSRMALKIIGAEEEEGAVKAISVHYALIGTLRAVPYMLNDRRLMLPSDILAKNDMSEQKIFDFNEVKNLPQVISEVLSSQNEFRYASTKVNSKFLKAMKAMAESYHVQIESAQYNVLDAKLAIRPKFFALRVWIKTLF